MDKFLDNLINSLQIIISDLVVLVLIYFLARLILKLVGNFADNTMDKAEKMKDKVKGQQIKTSMTVTYSAFRYIIYSIAILLVLRIVGLGKEVSGAVVAAGIGGLILSLGAQSIVEDMIAGLFLLFEKQYYVGEYVKIGDYEGTVASIALRVTYLDCAGKIVSIPNGEIRNVSNFTRAESIANITIPTPYDADTAKVISIIQKTVDKYYEENRSILTKTKPVIQGISNFSTSSVDINFIVRTKPLKHWQVEKELRLLIKEELEKKKIRLPYNQIINK